jgi:hypothetical protein
MRVWKDDALITRASVSSAVVNGDFSAALLPDWTDDDEGGTATSAQEGSGTLDWLRLTGDGTNAAIRSQEITIAAGDQAVEHGLSILVGTPDYDDGVSASHFNGSKVTFRVGTTKGDDDVVAAIALDNGRHSFAFTPNSASIWIQFENREVSWAFVQDVNFESSGALEMTTQWTAAQLDSIRWDQSGDIIYLASAGNQPQKILRYGDGSWGVTNYEPIDGPFNDINISSITLAPSALTGTASLTASGSLWKDSDIGRLVRVSSIGQTVTQTNIDASGADVWTTAIKVTGVTTQRIFTIIIADRTAATITLQRSLDSADSGFNDVTTYTSNQTLTYDDTLDNQIAWYRIGIKTADYGGESATTDLTLNHTEGSITGLVRISSVSSSTVAGFSTLKDFGNTDASPDWYLGSWSTRSGFPTCVALSEGRLAWAGKNKTWLSESDGYEDFDDETIGDSGPITRTIGSGPVDIVNWMVDTERLLLGTDGREHSVRASRDDEILTPTNAKIKKFGTQGSATVQAAEIDGSALFVQRGGDRLMEAAQGANFEYAINDLTTFYPEAGSSPFRRIAVQRQPDTRVHCVREDGSVAILLHDKAENISCWVMHTGGTVEDVVVLPGADGDGEDAVYYVVLRTVNSLPVRFLEKWSLESENQGGTTSKNLDAHITGTVSGGSMSGLDHLEGETVAAWVNGKDAGTYTVSSGAITGVTENGAACVGLAYTAQFKSTKLGQLVEKKNIKRLGVIMKNTHYQGLQYGPDFSSLYNLPKVKDGSAITADTVHTSFDEETFAFGGRWDSDSRVCLQAASPRPVTLLAAIVEHEE